MPLKIALIDSGVDYRRKEFINIDIESISLYDFKDDDRDTIGHGTAVAFIISKLLPCAKIFAIKLFEESSITNEDQLINTLEYIESSLPVDIVHISSGVVYPENLPKLREVCHKLRIKNIIVVSAFDNLGSISYPAALSDVIGVYWDKMCTSVNNYVYVKNSVINILGYAGILRLPWKDNTYKSVSGSSFAAPYITGLIGKFIMNGIKDFDNILLELEKDSTSIIDFKNRLGDKNLNCDKVHVKEIKSAITFPFNKEIHAILGNIDLLSFNINGAYDVPQFGHIGQDLKYTIYGKCILNQQLDSFKNINWPSNFDTVILGHTTLITKALKFDFINYFLDKCIKYKKNIYCFDDLSEYNTKISLIKNNGNFVIFPHLENDDFEIDTFGSLYKISCPVLGIFGTSPQQGKFNLQLDLRRELLNNGYRVGQLGTEPSSLLFGMDTMIPTGYNSGINLTPSKEIFYINSELAKIQNKDIILVGSQSQTIPYSLGNIGFYTFPQHHLLLASEPDAIILCINFLDDIDYIKRTITYLECYFQTPVIAFTLFPFIKEIEWSIECYRSRTLTYEEIDLYKQKIELTFGIPVFVNGSFDDLSKIYNKCIAFFTNE